MSPLRPLRPTTLRTSFLLVLFLGAVLPLGIVGWWLTDSTRKSGEELLGDRLDQTLSELVHSVGINWVDVRSEVLLLSEMEGVRAALVEDRAILSGADTAAFREMEEAWARVEAVASGVAFHDMDGEFRGGFPPEKLATNGGEVAVGGSLFPLRMPVYGRESEGQIGTMDVQLRMNRLLPSNLLLPGLGGSVLALFDATGRIPLTPLTIGPELLARDRFTWAGETWLAVRDTLYEPPLQLALAAPLGALGQPFTEAARRGLIALLLVAAGAFTLVTLATRKIAGPLERLADGADAVARGDLDRAVSESGPDEVQRVAFAFNTMTESLRQTLRELTQRESLAAVGEFAASLAHEVRNPLTAIRLDLQRARKHIGEPDTAGELVDQALHEVNRLDASVTDGLRLARSGRPSLAPLDLRHPLKAALHAAEPRFLSHGAILQPLVLPDEVISITGDAGALEQIFLNLLLNAAEAIGQEGRAGVTVELKGAEVCVSIWDEGTGITTAAMERVFEPFYSTSPEGTGLGLPIARRIAQAHGGDLEMESTPGEGTVARVTLPLGSLDPRSR